MSTPAPCRIFNCPPERMSRTAARSATRIGWFICGTHTTAPWPTRIRWVCIATAVRNNSGAEQCEYSSRKWCSTAQTVSNPSSSASRACSRALRYTDCSSRRPSGRGTDSSKKMPNFTSPRVCHGPVSKPGGDGRAEGGHPPVGVYLVYGVHEHRHRRHRVRRGDVALPPGAKREAVNFALRTLATEPLSLEEARRLRGPGLGR